MLYAPPRRYAAESSRDAASMTMNYVGSHGFTRAWLCEAAQRGAGVSPLCHRRRGERCLASR